MERIYKYRARHSFLMPAVWIALIVGIFYTVDASIAEKDGGHMPWYDYAILAALVAFFIWLAVHQKVTKIVVTHDEIAEYGGSSVRVRSPLSAIRSITIQESGIYENPHSVTVVTPSGEISFSSTIQGYNELLSTVKHYTPSVSYVKSRGS